MCQALGHRNKQTPDGLNSSREGSKPALSGMVPPPTPSHVCYELLKCGQCKLRCVRLGKKRNVNNLIDIFVL